MARTKVIAGSNGSETIPLTAAENAARDAEEQAWADGETDRVWEIIREKRNALLAASDWMANSDVTMSDAWVTYREALRDLPSTESDPDDIVFPTEPT
jgi:hypothetical protein